jgi:hypothetical protein
MSDSSHPLSPLTSKLDVPHYDDTDVRAIKWETARVTYTINRLKLGAHIAGQLRSSGSSNMTFEAFNERFPSFPVILTGTSLPGVTAIHRNTSAVHPMWFKSFCNLPFVKFYEDELQRYGTETSDTGGRPLGMVFPRKGFRDGLIVHNGDWQTFSPSNSSCHLFKGKNRHSTLLVQPYAAFLDHVRDKISWTSASS